MGIRSLEQIKIRNKKGIVSLRDLSRKDHIRLAALLLEENQKFKKISNIMILSNQKLRGQTTYLRGKLREKMSKV